MERIVEIDSTGGNFRSLCRQRA